jgi:hypothetical protein
VKCGGVLGKVHVHVFVDVEEQYIVEPVGEAPLVYHAPDLLVVQELVDIVFEAELLVFGGEALLVFQKNA